MAGFRCIFRLSFVFAFLSVLVFDPTLSSAQQNCGQMATCAAGQYGPGGCYRPHRQDCYDGRICAKNMRFCRPGGNGPGGCFLPSSGTCADGLICQTGMQVCNAGPNGPGGCFRLNYAQCFNGLICEPGMELCNDKQGPRCVRVGSNLCNKPNNACPQNMRECKPGRNGPGGCYRMGASTCTSGLICQTAMRVCNAGPNGPGGCFRLNYAQCFNGLICEPGMELCNDNEGPRCVRRGTNLCNRPADACPQGMRQCTPGPNGPGGCYRQNYMQCLHGAICEEGMRFCPAGANGTGGCYRLNSASCFSGLVCPTGMKACTDSQGPRCYKPGYGQCGSNASRPPFSPAPFRLPQQQPSRTPRGGSSAPRTGGWNVIQ